MKDAWAIEGLPKEVCLGVVRSEDVAGVLVFHVVPVIVDDRTQVTVQGRQASFASLLGKDEVLGREVSATFVVTEGGLCVARAVAFSGKEAEWTSSVDVPPSFSCDLGVLLGRAQDLLPEREDETATLSVRKRGRFVLLDGVD